MEINYQAIHKNVDKYIKREGKPKLFRGSKTNYRVPISYGERVFALLYPNTKSYYYPGDEHIQLTKIFPKYFNVDKIILDLDLIQRFDDMKEKLKSFDKTFIQRIAKGLVLRAFKPSKDFLPEDEIMINWMQCQENEYEMKNMQIQPSLSNAYAFTKYFKCRDKLAKELKKRNLNSLLISDKRLTLELERIPVKFRGININNYIRKIAIK